jgi:hypothetical protein
MFLRSKDAELRARTLIALGKESSVGSELPFKLYDGRRNNENGVYKLLAIVNTFSTSAALHLGLR